ncbi:MAG: hypothetical protein COT71_00030 [Candidatus Andersenbacteria bacterium CG10_big_fil_rev_8_21_14_0_10_54_11]|uniref:UDP-N-acetylglucosamine 2-epimerase domain-containing protein n=1 Tax=Candidatus Andersenbacteria bacterium CG10_big_fil_rev_8_21_14_0_10_54_11 TaxID=1974485 RepID=A0A2M6X0F9_9BACT|nr:MAG: hypothetical protein COT71_00030 [Candidatus Andersenbacteria bacterium CG10_big_fil_rev_8_21_14_0_10_54_11]
MKIALSVPSGYHARELLLPLHRDLDDDSDINQVLVITPAGDLRKQVFPHYCSKFCFVTNPKNITGHKQLLERERPDSIITDTNGLDQLDVPILQAARQLRIPTLTFIASWDNIWKIARAKASGQPYCNADRFIVWNKAMKVHLHRVFPEIAPEHILVIGAPRFDYFWHKVKIPSKSQLRAYLNLPDDDRPLIHFATTELYPLDYVIAAVHAARQSGTFTAMPHLYASVHPGGKIENHDHYAQKYNVTIRYSFGRHQQAAHPLFQYNPTEKDVSMLAALFTHADLLINHSSTVAIESFAGGTPVINIKYGRPLDWWRWRRSAVYRDFKEHYQDILIDRPTKVVYNKSQLIAAIQEYLANPTLDQKNRWSNLKRMITTVDGTAGKKVLAAIKLVASVPTS